MVLFFKLSAFIKNKIKMSKNERFVTFIHVFKILIQFTTIRKSATITIIHFEKYKTCHIINYIKPSNSTISNVTSNP